MKKIVILLSIIVGLCSCVKDIDLNVQEQPSKLVVTATWKENDVLTAIVSRTLNIKDKPRWSDEERYYVTNAQVSVYQDNVLYDQLVYHEQERKYKSITDKKAIPGFTYSIKVTAPGLEEATTMPIEFLPKVLIKSMEFKKEVGKTDYGELVDEIKITFDDPAQAKNFYLIKVSRDEYDGGHYVYPMDKDVVVSLEEDPFATSASVPANRIIFSDRTFNGQTKSITLRVPSYFLRDWQGGSQAVKGNISLFNVSEEVFLYNRSRILDSENPFAEPVQPYTNITNGMGIFGLLGGDTKSIQ